ncbi:hypothetical protein R1sor_014965 [Riccia sorocarpa]|uniref:Uncharacterized protein n=1 Tax=Riccia sorocarpa TaxID=122646 RepID=A0ABD3HCQ8_9MARC
MESSTSGTVPRALDVLAILGLLQLIYEVTVPIIHKAEQVYYHKKKCRTFGRKIAEIQNTLKAAKLDLFEDLYKNQKFNKFVKERLNELKETLSHAEQLVGELQSRRKGIAARISGEASSRIDAYERDIGESINLLNFHLVVMLLSEFSAAQVPTLELVSLTSPIFG